MSNWPEEACHFHPRNFSSSIGTNPLTPIGRNDTPHIVCHVHVVNMKLLFWHQVDGLNQHGLRLAPSQSRQRGRKQYPNRMPYTVDELLELDSLNCLIPHSLDALDVLHAHFPWVPNRHMIRPTEHVLMQKHLFLDRISTLYASWADSILDQVFMCPTMKRDGDCKLVARPGSSATRRQFERQRFPYALPEGTRHYVMWYMNTQGTPTEHEVSSHIQIDIRNRIGHSRFEFVWYENPKMTIQDIYHVQVFWRVFPKPRQS